MNEGWVCIYRKLKEWQWYKFEGMLQVWMWLLLSAASKPYKHGNIVIQRGQYMTGRKQLANNIGLSEQTIRTCLSRLQGSGEIVVKSTNKFSIITICNYDSYQGNTTSIQPTINQQLTNNQPTTNQQSTNNQPLINNINNITIKQEDNIVGGTNVPLSAEPTAARPATVDLSENTRKSGEIETTEPTLLLTAERAEKEKNCAKKEKGGGGAAEYKWDEIRDWFNAQVAQSQIPQVRAFSEKRKAAFRKAMKTYGRDKVAEAIRKAARIPFLNGDNDRRFVADFDFIVNPNKLPRIIEGFYDHLHEQRKPPARKSAQQHTLDSLKKILNETENTDENDDNGNNQNDAVLALLRGD